MTVQQQLKAKLEQTGIPYRAIECYGSQIVITSQSQESANKWASLLSRFAKVRGITQGLDERKAEVEPKYGRSSMEAQYVKVWRTFARI